jgi:hypothetical protein
MSIEKDSAPLERAKPPKGGFFDFKKILLLGVAVVAIGGLAAWGFSIRGEDTAEMKVSDVQPAHLNVNDARPPAWTPPADPPVDTGTGQDTGTHKATGTAKRKGSPEGFRKISPVVMRRSGGGGQQGQQTAQAPSQGGQGGYPGRGGYSGGDTGGYPGQEGYDQSGGQGNSGRRDRKMEFYQGGGASMAGDLDVAGELVGELQGCVIKAGAQITLSR